MATHVNFYENIAEALLRLKQSIVLYDGEPFYIWTVTDHKGDGVFRVYMTPLEKVHSVAGIIPAGNQVPHGHAAAGGLMDSFVETKPELVIRKMMNSSLFNKFRPFPLGMCNQGLNAFYVARQPARPKTEQGLTSSMLYTSMISPMPAKKAFNPIDMYTESFRDCIIGKHPSPKMVLENLLSSKYENESVAFHREFALCKGPIDLIFLAYRDEIIGVLPKANFDLVKIGRKFLHTREVVQELNLFSSVS